MSQLRRVSVLAVLFAVLLRMAIGWQFFYEGLWKYDSLDTAKPWTSAGYLANARGPLRDHFRSMVPDPDGLGWLDFETVDNRWIIWENEFREHYGLDAERLSEAQAELNEHQKKIDSFQKSDIPKLDARLKPAVIELMRLGDREIRSLIGRKSYLDSESLILLDANAVDSVAKKYKLTDGEKKKLNEPLTQIRELLSRKYALQIPLAQSRELTLMLDGPKEIVGRNRFESFAKGIRIGGTLARKKIIEARKDSKNRYYLVVDGKQHLTPKEYSDLLRSAKKVEEREQAKAKAAKDAKDDAALKAANAQIELAKSFADAVEDVFTRSSRLAYREKLAALLKGDPERVSFIRKEHPEGTIDHQRPAKTGQYKDRLERYNTALAEAKLGFQDDHLKSEYKRIMELKAELVGPVKQLETEMKTKARALLTSAQLDQGPPETPCPFTDFDIQNVNVAQADMITMWSLMILGGLLIVGFFSRVSAFLGAFLVLSFYLVMPPWPGVPEAPGPEHSLFVNKNLIEVIALLMLAFIPTGKWFGLDAFCVWLFPGRHLDSTESKRRPNSSSGKRPDKAKLSPAERVVQSSGQPKPAEPVAEKKESVPPTPEPAPAAKDTYPVKTEETRK